MDHSQNLHAIIAILSLYMFILFAWWWIKQGRATTIYGFTCFLMLGIFMTHSGAFYAYHEMRCGHGLSVLTQYWWPYRNYPQLISLFVYAVYMTERACFGRWVGNYGRRKTDL